MSDRKRHGLVLLLVVALIAASFAVIATKPTSLGLDLKGGVELVYQGQPTAQEPHVTQAALQRAVDVMENRVNQLGVSQALIQTQSGNQIIVQLPNVHNVAQAEAEVGTTARLEFYDWEANVLTPAGKPAADGLLDQDPGSLTLSQAGGGQPGVNSSSAGAMSFYNAVKLASKQPYSASKQNANFGNQYFLFGAPGSSACQAYYKATGKKPQPGVHCLISGPVSVPTSTSRSAAIRQLEAGLSPAETKGAQVLVVKRGTVVLEAASPNFSTRAPYGSPNAGYYVLHDNVA
ncbi:MAG TPA: hypothetical protein VME01_09815, partial [Solirubrobacteraceae bacterium]|nr:hypothetical protein [Solirubrobacteraceae bacterium]